MKKNYLMTGLAAACGCAGAVPCHPTGAAGTEDAEWRKIRNAVPVAFGTAFLLIF